MKMLMTVAAMTVVLSAGRSMAAAPLSKAEIETMRPLCGKSATEKEARECVSAGLGLKINPRALADCAELSGKDDALKCASIAAGREFERVDCPAAFPRRAANPTILCMAFGKLDHDLERIKSDCRDVATTSGFGFTFTDYAGMRECVQDRLQYAIKRKL